MVKKISKEKIHNAKMFEEHQVNLILVATLISAVSLMLLIFVNRSLNVIGESFATTRAVILGLSIAFAVAGVVFFVLSYVKSKTFIEYGVLGIVLAICYWGIYGMPFVKANGTALISSVHARYITVAVSILYLIVSYIVHIMIIKKGVKNIKK